MTQWVKEQFTIAAIESLLINATTLNETFNGLAKHFINKEVCHQSPIICKGQVSAAVNRWNLGPEYILKTCEILHVSISITQINRVNDIIKENKKTSEKKKSKKNKKKEINNDKNKNGNTQNSNNSNKKRKLASNSNQNNDSENTENPSKRRRTLGYRSGAHGVK